ncbi:MAG: metallophosphoesterase [Deltaproteobacteria bacterium]|nr:metallophosphoesterase [Deltaproteobacteria bacterium]TLN04545.1 MAG: metallophosphoesterase [bacterium]
MSLFLLTFISLYAGMHYYAFRKVNAAFPLTILGTVSLAAWMMLMVLAPVLVRFIEKKGLESVAVPLAVTGYTWMGFLFLFCVTMVMIDFGRVLLWLGGLCLQREALIFVTARQAFLFAGILALGISIYGFFEAQAVRLEKVVIPTSKLPPSINSFRIVQISDVHVGLIIREQRLQRIIREIERAKPDLLVSTGDLVDGQLDGMTTLSDALGKVHTPFGKIAVTGNHEFYAGIKNSMDFMRNAGFSVLQGELLDVAGILTVVGVDDPAGVKFGSGKISEEGLLKKAPQRRYVVLLKHRPVVSRQNAGFFDLQLSGHIHKGQIFPFGLATHLFYPVQTGLSRVLDTCFLYVSRGTGTWGPPIRFLAPPEVSVIDLVRVPEEN